MAVAKCCFNNVHLQKLLVCTIFITLKACSCMNVSRNAITLIDSFSPMFHGMGIEDDCKSSNAYHTCGCRCTCSYNNSTFNESSQKCVNNAELRIREGCQYGFVDTSKEDPPIVLSRTAANGKPNKFQLHIPTGKECRFYMWEHNKYLSCDGSWESLTSTHVHHTFYLVYDFTAKQSFLELVSIKPEGKFPFLNGRLVRLVVDCKAVGTDRFDRSCVLVKLEGTVHCPSSSQRSMARSWNHWPKEYADNRNTSSQIDYVETSSPSGYNSKYETMSPSIKPNSCNCVYPPRPTPSPLTTPSLLHQTAARETRVQRTATISNYVQVKQTPTVVVSTTGIFSSLLVTHSLKKPTAATILISKPENGSLDINNVHLESGERASLSLMTIIGAVTVAGILLIVLIVLCISLVHFKIKQQRNVARITATGEKETSNTNEDEDEDVYEEPCIFQLDNLVNSQASKIDSKPKNIEARKAKLNSQSSLEKKDKEVFAIAWFCKPDIYLKLIDSVAIEDDNGNFNTRRTSAEPLVPVDKSHSQRQKRSSYEDIELVKYSVNDLYEASNHEGSLDTRIDSQAAAIKHFDCNPIYPTIAVFKNTDNKREVEGCVGISNDSTVSSLPVSETSGFYQNSEGSIVDGNVNGISETVGGKPVFQSRTCSKPASLAGGDCGEEQSYQNIGSSGLGNDDPSDTFQEQGETAPAFNDTAHKYDVAESILGSEYTVAEPSGIKVMKSAGSLPTTACGKLHSYYDAGATI